MSILKLNEQYEYPQITLRSTFTKQLLTLKL
jgi:hypothetical protein